MRYIEILYRDIEIYEAKEGGVSPGCTALGWVTPLRPQNNLLGIFHFYGVNTFSLLSQVDCLSQ